MSSNITLKNQAAIKIMQELGQIANQIFNQLEIKTQAGISSAEINQLAEKLISEHKVESALIKHGLSKSSIFVSINSKITGGIPNNQEKLNPADLVKINLALSKSNYTIDATKTFIVNPGALIQNRLIQAAIEITEQTILTIKAGIKIGDIGHTIEKLGAKYKNFSIVKDLCGHGIGSCFDEDNYQIKNYGTPGLGLTLQAGMTFTLEPVLTSGKQSITENSDASISTKDNSLSALFSHTILVTDSGFEILA